MIVTFVSSQQLTGGIYEFHFQPEKSVDYLAGQFIELTLPHSKPDARGIKHWFTLSSSPSEELLAITTKFATPKSSFKHTLSQLMPGCRIHMSEPMGDFVLPRDVSIPLVFIAGGIGITPFRSMVKWLSDMNEARDVQLLYATKTPNQAVYADLFQSYGLKMSNPRSLVLDDVTNLQADSRTIYYLAGPEIIVEAFTKELIARGIDSHRVVTDYFPNYSVV